MKFSNEALLGTGNEMLIYLNAEHAIPDERFYWQTEETQIQSNKYLINEKTCGSEDKAKEMAEKDYSGYENCLRIHDIVSKDPYTYGEIPAIEYCLNLNENGHQGYLPSMGQLRILSDNIDLINYIFEYLYLNIIKKFNIGNWWGSSTEFNNDNSWSMINCSTIYCTKAYNTFRIFPLFACKK